jgi:hypothetical protein
MRLTRNAAFIAAIYIGYQDVKLTFKKRGKLGSAGMERLHLLVD